MIRERLGTVDKSLCRNAAVGFVTVQTIMIANTTSDRRTVRLHHIMQGETSSAANAILYDTAIAPNSTLVISCYMMLKAGEELRGLADAVGVTVTLYGINAP